MADQVLAKLILAVVALIAGVGGIWLLYAGAVALVSLFGPRMRDRIMPWIFVVPALLHPRRLAGLPERRDLHHQLHRRQDRRLDRELGRCAAAKA